MKSVSTVGEVPPEDSCPSVAEEPWAPASSGRRQRELTWCGVSSSLRAAKGRRKVTDLEERTAPREPEQEQRTEFMTCVRFAVTWESILLGAGVERSNAAQPSKSLLNCSVDSIGFP